VESFLGLCPLESNDRAVSRAVRRRFLTAKSGVQSWVTFDVRGGPSATGAGFSSSFSW
jgi:hypothetical protein